MYMFIALICTTAIYKPYHTGHTPNIEIDAEKNRNYLQIEANTSRQKMRIDRQTEEMPKRERTNGEKM